MHLSVLLGGVSLLAPETCLSRLIEKNTLVKIIVSVSAYFVLKLEYGISCQIFFPQGFLVRKSFDSTWEKI